MSLLSEISSPADLKKLPPESLPELASEIRREIIDVTSQKGGHVSPNLGIVELSIALHRVFDTPKDKILFDVSHQCYTHKLLTGRNNDKFKTLRQTGGISGFCNRFESEHDAFGAGHAGTAASAALGLAAARDRLGGDENVVAVLGDAALTNGVTFEAFNNIASTTKKMIVVLNDNEMSIAKNVGAIAQYLNEVITNPACNRLYSDMNSFLKKLPFGETVIKMTENTARDAKGWFVPSPFFEYFGLMYLGPIDGHDIPLLERYLNYCKRATRPILLHVITKKGKGLDAAVRNPEKFHGASPYNIVTGESLNTDKSVPNYQDAMGQALLKFAKDDKKIVGITAAMASGTGLSFIKNELPQQFFDVGIAEEHAAVFAAGMACKEFTPVVAIYSTFMQRAYDSILHDICMQKLHVTMCLDRAGLVGDDGYTHHGVFDYAYLRSIPNMTIMAPKDENELRHMLKTALSFNGPISVRYPRGSGVGVDITEPMHELPIGKAEVLREGKELCFWAIGSMVQSAVQAADKLKEQGIDAGVVNMRFAKPLDKELLIEHAKRYGKIVTLEEGVLAGGVGSEVLEILDDAGLLQQCVVLRLGIPDEFVTHGDKKLLFRDLGLDTDAIVQKAAAFVKGE